MKNNQKWIKQKIDKGIDDAKGYSFVRLAEQYACGHGRLEHRKIEMVPAPEDIKRKFPDCQYIGRVTKVTTNMKTEQDTTHVLYFITSLKKSAEEILQAMREHWGIENLSHRVRDVNFQEDASTLRTKNAPENMTFVRCVCIAIVHFFDEKITETIEHFRRFPGRIIKFLIGN